MGVTGIGVAAFAPDELTSATIPPSVTPVLPCGKTLLSVNSSLSRWMAVGAAAA